MQKVDKLLKTNIKKYMIEDKIKGYQDLKCWEAIISEVLPEARGKTMAVSFDKGVLKIASLSREVAELIRMLAKRIIYALNSLFTKPAVFRLECVC